MPKRMQRRPESEKLIARIDHIEPSYFISRNNQQVGDEACLGIEATIEKISRRHVEHVGRMLSVSLLIERRFEAEASVDHPRLFSVNLSKTQRSVLAYLPADAFWGLTRLIELGATHIEATFSPTHRGYSDLESLHVASLSTASSIGWETD